MLLSFSVLFCLISHNDKNPMSGWFPDFFLTACLRGLSIVFQETAEVQMFVTGDRCPSLWCVHTFKTCVSVCSLAGTWGFGFFKNITLICHLVVALSMKLCVCAITDYPDDMVALTLFNKPSYFFLSHWSLVGQKIPQPDSKSPILTSVTDTQVCRHVHTPARP